jgi:undecaprenyl diphosphate synthase
MNDLPAHIAIIMDGNGRWATQRGLPRIAGHQAGIQALKRIVQAAGEMGVQYLTVYAFSTENWDRPHEEVDFLMTLFSQTIDREVQELHNNNVQLRFLGRIEGLAPSLQQKIASAEEQLVRNTGLRLNVMVNYGGRMELVDAFHKLAEKLRTGELREQEIQETTISRHLYTAGIPDPDLLIRTAREFRISNFLLWQMAYTELWITRTLWPDSDRSHLLGATEAYTQRTRKFGKVTTA